MLPRPSVAGIKGAASRCRQVGKGTEGKGRGREREKRDRDGGKGESREVETGPPIG